MSSRANYLIADQLGRFVWMEELLEPKNKNQMKLECYHHNSLRALLQAWHFYGLAKYSFEVGLLQRWSNPRASLCLRGGRKKSRDGRIR
jgi:hypothetical protein